MITILSIYVYAFGLLLAGIQEKGDAVMNDPYSILAKHYEAVGGLEKLKKVKTTDAEGKIVIEGTGLQGTFKQWSEKPLRTRMEVDLGVVKNTSGDNGKLSWSIDQNNKILFQRDETTMKERKVREQMELYQHLDPESPRFTLEFTGIEKVGDIDCYVVKITNKVNANVQSDYYDTGNFYLLQTIETKPDMEQRTTYTDFRTVSGFVVPFRETVLIMPVGQKQVLEYTKYEFDKEIDRSLFEPPAEDVEDFQFANGKNAEDIPFEYIEDHLFLPVNINGREVLWVLDCGASVSVIDSGYAVDLGLELAGSIKGQAASGVVTMNYVALPPFTVKGIDFKAQKILSMGIRGLFKRTMGMELGGILGYDFLSRFVTKIDYANKTISFYDPDNFKYQGTGKVIDSPLGEERMFRLSATVDRKYSGKWRLDIGASGPDFLYPYAKEHGLLGLRGVEVMAAGAGGMFKNKISKFKTIELSGFTVTDPLIGMPCQEDPGAFSVKSLTGNMGNTFLRHFVLYLDYKNQRVIIEPGKDYTKAFPEAKSGFQLWYNDRDEIEVFFVASGTPADKAGFKKGDIIKSINGITANYFGGIISIRELIKEKTGTVYTIKVMRGGDVMETQLVLQDLY